MEIDSPGHQANHQDSSKPQSVQPKTESGRASVPKHAAQIQAAAPASVTAESQQQAQQAEQATAAGMDAFEHSQALAERRASGSQAGPSSATGLSMCPASA